MDRIFEEYPVSSVTLSWKPIRAAKRLAERAIERAESEVDGE